MTFDSRMFRDALGCFATGVTVATLTTEAGQPVGVTINSFTSVSLDPPLILFCLGRPAQVAADFQTSRYFAINILSEGQQAVSDRFAAPPHAGSWTDVAVQRSPAGCPWLAGCLAYFDCALESVHDGGDHLILIGRVLTVERGAGGPPLLYFRGAYAGLSGTSGV